MDFELMIGSFPKLLSATVITLKLLSLSLFFGLFIGLLFAILRMNKNPIVNKFAYGYSYVLEVHHYWFKYLLFILDLDKSNT